MDDARARELMVAASGGDEQAFAELVDAFRVPVLQVIYRTLGRHHADAEDLAQDVFVRMFRARARYRPDAPFRAWLFRIVTNRCLNHLRDTKGKRALSLSGGEDADDRIDPADPRPEDPGQRAMHAELAAVVAAAIERLPATQRMAIIYARYEELSQAEIAAIMGLTEKGVKSLLFRARENLRRLLGPELERLGESE